MSPEQFLKAFEELLREECRRFSQQLNEMEIRSPRSDMSTLQAPFQAKTKLISPTPPPLSSISHLPQSPQPRSSQPQPSPMSSPRETTPPTTSTWLLPQPPFVLQPQCAPPPPNLPQQSPPSMIAVPVQKFQINSFARMARSQALQSSVDITSELEEYTSSLDLVLPHRLSGASHQISKIGEIPVEFQFQSPTPEEKPTPWALQSAQRLKSPPTQVPSLLHISPPVSQPISSISSSVSPDQILLPLQLPSHAGQLDQQILSPESKVWEISSKSGEVSIEIKSHCYASARLLVQKTRKKVALTICLMKYLSKYSEEIFMHDEKTLRVPPKPPDLFFWMLSLPLLSLNYYVAGLRENELCIWISTWLSCTKIFSRVCSILIDSMKPISHLLGDVSSIVKFLKADVYDSVNSFFAKYSSSTCAILDEQQICDGILEIDLLPFIRPLNVQVFWEELNKYFYKMWKPPWISSFSIVVYVSEAISLNIGFFLYALFDIVNKVIGIIWWRILVNTAQKYLLHSRASTCWYIFQPLESSSWMLHIRRGEQNKEQECFRLTGICYFVYWSLIPFLDNEVSKQLTESPSIWWWSFKRVSNQSPCKKDEFCSRIITASWKFMKNYVGHMTLCSPATSSELSLIIRNQRSDVVDDGIMQQPSCQGETLNGKFTTEAIFRVPCEFIIDELYIQLFKWMTCVRKDINNLDSVLTKSLELVSVTLFFHLFIISVWNNHYSLQGISAQVYEFPDVSYGGEEYKNIHKPIFQWINDTFQRQLSTPFLDKVEMGIITTADSVQLQMQQIKCWTISSTEYVLIRPRPPPEPPPLLF